MAVALLDPEPVAERDARTQCQCAPGGDIPRRRKEEEIDGEEDGREEVEGEIGHDGQLCPFGKDEVLVDLGTPSPISAVSVWGAREREECLTDRILQYRMATSTSRGVVHAESAFLARNNVWEDVMSAREPQAKVAVARLRPMMVRYWKCQP